MTENSVQQIDHQRVNKLKNQAMISKNLKAVKTNNFAVENSDKKPQKGKKVKKDERLVYKSRQNKNFGTKSEVPNESRRRQQDKQKNLTNILDIPSIVYGEGETMHESSLDESTIRKAGKKERANDQGDPKKK